MSTLLSVVHVWFWGLSPARGTQDLSKPVLPQCLEGTLLKSPVNSVFSIVMFDYPGAQAADNLLTTGSPCSAPRRNSCKQQSLRTGRFRKTVAPTAAHVKGKPGGRLIPRATPHPNVHSPLASQRDATLCSGFINKFNRT